MQKQNRWSKCPKCGKHVHELQWGTFRRCPFCRCPQRLTVEERIAITFDEGKFNRLTVPVETQNKLNFPNYDQKLAKSRQQSGHGEAVTIGWGTIAGNPVAAGIMDNRFMMGTLSTVTGTALRQIMRWARHQGYPLILFTASGGARMQEGIYALLQMNTILAEQRRLREAGGLSINVLTDPTMGGVSASFAFKSDYVIAEGHAQIGFSGKRVIQQAIGEDLPAGFQTAEYLLQHGQLDSVVQREELRGYLQRLLRLHGYGG